MTCRARILTRSQLPKPCQRPAVTNGLCTRHWAALGELEELRRPGPVDREATGRQGGYARAAKLTPERRSEIARTAGRARWANRTPSVD